MWLISTLFSMRKGRGAGGGVRGQKGPATSFSPANSTNVGNSPKNFLTATLVSNFKIITSASLKLLTLNQDHPLKKCFSWSNSYKIEVMITSLIEMVELTNFGHMTTLTMFIWVTWWNFVGHIMHRNYDVITFILKYLYFKKT